MCIRDRLLTNLFILTHHTVMSSNNDYAHKLSFRYNAYLIIMLRAVFQGLYMHLRQHRPVLPDRSRPLRSQRLLRLLSYGLPSHASTVHRPIDVYKRQGLLHSISMTAFSSCTCRIAGDVTDALPLPPVSCTSISYSPSGRSTCIPFSHTSVPFPLLCILFFSLSCSTVCSR